MMESRRRSVLALCLCVICVSTLAQDAVLTWKIVLDTYSVVMRFDRNKLINFTSCMCNVETLGCNIYAPPNGFVSFVEHIPVTADLIKLHNYTNYYICEKVSYSTFVRCVRLIQPPCENPGACWSYYFHYGTWNCGVGHVNVAWIFTQHLELSHDESDVFTTIVPCGSYCTSTSISTTSVSTTSIPGSIPSIPGSIPSVPASTATVPGQVSTNVTTPDSVKQEDSDDHSAIIIGVVIGFLAFVALVLAGIFIFKRKASTFKVMRNNIVQFHASNASTSVTLPTAEQRNGVQNHCASETPTYDDQVSHLSFSSWEDSNSPVHTGETGISKRASQYCNVQNGTVSNGHISFYANMDDVAASAYTNKGYETLSSEGQKPQASGSGVHGATGQTEQTQFPGYSSIDKHSYTATSDGHQDKAISFSTGVDKTAPLPSTHPNFYEIPVVPENAQHASNRNPFVSTDAARPQTKDPEFAEENIYFELNDFAQDDHLDDPVPEELAPSPPTREVPTLKNSVSTPSQSPANGCRENNHSTSGNSAMAAEIQPIGTVESYVNTDFEPDHNKTVNRRVTTDATEPDAHVQDRQSKQYFEIENNASIRVKDAASKEEPIWSTTLEMDENIYEDLDI